MILDQYSQYLSRIVQSLRISSQVFPTNFNNLYEFLIDIFYIKMHLIRAQPGVSIF
jgi:hypothetical protein